MGILNRLKSILQAFLHRLASGWEDPRGSVNYSLNRLEETQAQVNRSLVEVSAARERLYEQYNHVAAAIEKYQEQAKAALYAGREDLARVALERRQAAEARRGEMEGSIAGLDRQLENLKSSQAGLQRKIELFRSRKEELAAVYDASRVQVQLQETLTGISNDISDVGHTIQRAEARIQEMRSRADAIERLVAEGVLVDVLEPGQDDVDRELARINRTQAIEEELARLKGPSELDNPKHMLPRDSSS